MTDKPLINLENVRQGELREQGRARACCFCGEGEDDRYLHHHGRAGFAHDNCRLEAGLPMHPEDIRLLRKAMGLKESEFAAFLGATDRTVRRWEVGTRPVSEEAESKLRIQFMKMFGGNVSQES